jgi:adenylylsulfate kinase
MRMLIFGLPGSGKTTLAQEVAKQIPCLHLNGDKVRDLFNDRDFSMDGRLTQAKRMRVLADMARDMLVIADFVCPTEETRKIFDADLTVWMNTVEGCRYENTNAIFELPKEADIIVTVKDAKSQVLRVMELIKEVKV